MLSKMASFSLAGLMIVGGTVALSAPAEAAAKKCAVGTWTLTSLAATNVATVDGSKVVSKLTGGAGTKLKIAATVATYDFSKSKPEILTANVQGTVVQAKFTYRKTLKYGLKLTGAAKGTFTPKLKTVTGPATVSVVIKPSPAVTTAPLAPMVKTGDDPFIIRVKAISACTKRTLTLAQKVIETNDGSTTVRKLSYRRTK
jgi:hypothetical protein